MNGRTVAWVTPAGPRLLVAYNAYNAYNGQYEVKASGGGGVG